MDSPHDSRLELEARPLLDAPDIELGERGKRGSGSAVALFLSLLFMFSFLFLELCLPRSTPASQRLVRA